MTFPDVVGVVLCGGRSSRMGRDKNFVSWAGRPLLQHVLRAMEQVCSEIILVQADFAQPLPVLELKVPMQRLVDETPGAGPAASALVGFEHLRRLRGLEPMASSVGRVGSAPHDSPTVLLTGNDSPLLRPILLRYLIQRLRADNQIDAVVPRSGVSGGLGQPPTNRFPLCAAYRLRSADILSSYIQEGGRSLKGWLDRLRVDEVPEGDLRTHDPELVSLINLNTLQDLSELEKQAREPNAPLLD
jgi:molybdenum cofactor guanylyltransferase